MAGDTNKPDLADNAASALVGRTIGDFEVIEEIGRGGMGVVFKARQISLDRIVALKVLSNSLGLRGQAIERFRREAQATAKLQHPNIVPIYAQGQDDTTYYYAMQLVSGHSLHDTLAEMRSDVPDFATTETASGSSDIAFAETELIDRGSDAAGASGLGLSGSRSGSRGADARKTLHDRYTNAYYDEIARQVRGVADALDYAHRHGIIHRDIKPHNLLVGEQERLSLTDFGLARVLEQPGVTVTGEFVGSPLYMSPEQISGRVGKIGPATDVYSLGATMYEWLTLRPPFPGQTREEVITKVITADIPPPRTLNPSVPIDLETICLKALEKEPSKRYQSAAEVRDDLQRFLDRSNIRARRAGPIASTAKLIARRPVETTIVVAMLLVLVLGAALFRQRRESRDSEQTIAAQQHTVEEVTQENERLQRERDELSSAMTLGENLATMLNVEGLLSTSRTETAQRYTPVTDAQRIGAMFLTSYRQNEQRRLESAPPESVDPRYVQALTQAQSTSEALDLLDAVLTDAPERIEARILRAWILCQISDTEAMLSEADAIRRLVPNRFDGYAAMGAARLLDHQYALAKDDFVYASELLPSDYRLDLLHGMTLTGLKEYDAAAASIGRALILDANNVLALLARAHLSQASGHLEHAVADLTRVIQLESKNSEAYEQRGECYDRLERYHEAAADYGEAFRISGKYDLLAKIAASMANGDEQRIAQERNQATTPPESIGDDTSSMAPLKAPAIPSTLRNAMKRAGDQPEASVSQETTPIARTVLGVSR